MTMMTNRPWLRHTLLGLLLGCVTLAGHVPAGAQLAPLPPIDFDDDRALARRAAAAGDPAEALARYLRVLNAEPQDLDALMGAGEAALDIGDANAAISFFARAEEISPRNGRAKAGLGSAMVQLVQPRPALKLFEEALDYGVPLSDIAADRGLAYDLRGDTKRARADYELVLKSHADAETTRRLAISQAIAGDGVAAMATLDPLLRKQDKAAWRARAFVMAITGDVKGAESTARAVLTRPQAEALVPYLTRLPKLKASQKAAAAHFGQFPSDGRQYSEAELFAAAGITVPAVPVTSTPAKPEPVRKKADPMADDLGDGIGLSETIKLAVKQERSPKKAAAPASTPAPTPAPAEAAPLAKLALTTLPNQKSEKATPKNGKEVKPEEKSAARNGAKDAAKDSTKKAEQDRKEADKKKAAAPEKANASRSKEPERHWVQIATGAYKPDLGKEWTRLKAKYPALLGQRTPWTTPLNRTNRLLIGPFKTADQAQDFVNKAADSGFVISRFTSPAGQAVEKVAN